MARSRRPPIPPLPDNVIRHIYEGMGYCYDCGYPRKQCRCATPLPHVTPPDYDSPDKQAQAESDRINQWLTDHWDTIPEIPL